MKSTKAIKKYGTHVKPYLFAGAIIVAALLAITLIKPVPHNKAKVYWLIPDGYRADPDTFKVFEWAREGKLPNIKRMMDKGAYGYSMPLFPSHTPVNYAALLTGSYPKTNHVADGPMHVENRTLGAVAVSGFSSVAKSVDPIWVTAEKQGAKVALISVPGSTPPELENGITVRGRWGGWGADLHSLNYESKVDLKQRIAQGRSSKLFFLGAELTRYIGPTAPLNWTREPLSYSPGIEIELVPYGMKVYGYIFDSTDDNKTNYDMIAFSADKNSTLAVIREGEQTDWLPAEFLWNNISFDSHMILRAIKLDDDGFFRIRVIVDNMNKYIIEPSVAASAFENVTGPMVDFPDNFPPQLIYYPEDKAAFLSEMDMSFDWHAKAAPFVLNEYKPDMAIWSIYAPNQMLTSRWWLGFIDPMSRRYNNVSDEERKELWNETLAMYQKMDKIVGEVLDSSDENTIVVLSSDHGAVPLDRSVHLNNLFAEKGWLKFTINNNTGEPVIDWENSTVIYLKMDNVYINPDGLGEKWIRGSGEEYELLRQEVKNALTELEDPLTGEKPVSLAIEWEGAGPLLGLPADRVGDLVVANIPGYGWDEEMSLDHEIFGTPLVSGYKQAILPEDAKGMWTPFIIMGPGIKKGYEMNRPIAQIDQYPTIMRIAGYDVPGFVDGKAVVELYS